MRSAGQRTRCFCRGRLPVVVRDAACWCGDHFGPGPIPAGIRPPCSRVRSCRLSRLDSIRQRNRWCRLGSNFPHSRWCRLGSRRRLGSRPNQMGSSSRIRSMRIRWDTRRPRKGSTWLRWARRFHRYNMSIRLNSMCRRNMSHQARSKCRCSTRDPLGTLCRRIHSCWGHWLGRRTCHHNLRGIHSWCMPPRTLRTRRFDARYMSAHHFGTVPRRSRRHDRGSHDTKLEWCMARLVHRREASGTEFVRTSRPPFG